MTIVKKLFHIILIVSSLTSTIACHKESVINDNANDLQFSGEGILGISKGENDLSESDAVTVAKIYEKNRVSTKVGSSKTIKNIVTIPDENGLPAIYAINFDDGYIWVSASKKLCPILAVVDHGTFSLDNSKIGIDIIKQDYLELMGQCEITDSIKRFWRKYETPIGNQEISTRISDEYVNELNRLKEYARDNNYRMYRLSDAADNDMPEWINNSLTDIASDAYAGRDFDGSEYDYPETAYILERDFDELLQYGPLTSTKWNQVSPYNTSVPNGKLLGCVTVATAQFMRYFKKPDAYVINPGKETEYTCNWMDMPNTTSNNTLSMFLADLRSRLGINDNGYGSVDDIVPLLKSKFEYKWVNIYDYDIDKLRYPLSINRLVILRGRIPNGDGHVWICDGLRYLSYCGTEYRLFVLDYQAYPDFEYIDIKKEVDNAYFSTPYCSMNWGWGGDHDGWFFGSNWNSGSGNFSTERKMIY